MNIKRIIKEEMDDLQWMDDISSKPNMPQHGVAWCILDIPNTSNDSLTLQKYLKTIGFTWPSGEELIDVRPYSVGSVWSDNISNSTYAYSGRSDDPMGESGWLMTLSRNSSYKELYVYTWNGTHTDYSHTLSI